MPAAITVSITLVAATVMWMIRYMTDPTPLALDSAAVLGADLVVLAVIGATGMLLGASRLAKRLSIVVAGSALATGLFMPVNALWAAAAGATAVALTGLAGPWTRSVIRRLPASDAPPAPAALLPLIALGAPAVVALTSPDGFGAAQWTAICSLLVSAFLYARAAPGALLAVRVVLPAILTVTAVLVDGWGVRSAIILIAAVLTSLAWRSAARVAIRPLVRPGRAVPILAELVPDDILDAAGLDDRGRRRHP